MKSMKLVQIETSFQQYLLHQTQEIKDSISPHPTLSVSDRLNIYYDAYRLRLIEILSNDYPKLQTLMGLDAFNRLAYDYLEAHPSPFFSVRYFGKALSAFLENNSDYPEPYLSEMAAFEWALGNTLDSEDAPHVDFSTLQSMDPSVFPTIKLGFHPSLYLLNFKWNVPTVWQTIESEPLATDCLSNLKDSEGQYWIVYRQHIESFFRSIENEEAFALQKMQQNFSIAELCDALLENDLFQPETIPQFVLKCLHQWLSDGIVFELRTQ